MECDYISHIKNMTILSEMKDYLSPNLLWAKGHPYLKTNTTLYPNQKSPFLTKTLAKKVYPFAYARPMLPHCTKKQYHLLNGWE